jgi:hypothetical protein
MMEIIEESMCISRKDTHGIQLDNIYGWNSHIADERALQYVQHKYS